MSSRRRGRPASVPAGRRERLDWFEAAVLLTFAAISLWLVALNLYYASVHQLVWTGIDGPFPLDQLQYLAWIRDASRHVLVSDLFVSHVTPHDYLQPAIAISGGLAALGIAPWLALLVWKPIAVGAMFLAARAYCRDTLAGVWQRRAALVLGLFAGSFAAYGNEWIPFMSWGYPFDLLAVAALTAAVVTYSRARSGRSSALWAPGLGLLAAWLHPWQGELLIVVVAGGELIDLLVSGRGINAIRGIAAAEVRRRSVLAATTVVATALPLIYYALLRHLDPAWRTAAAASQLPWPLPRILLSLAPLLIAAVPAYLRRPRDFLGTATRVWPLAALIVWALNETGIGGWSLYAWVGITIPLGVLSVEGMSSTRLSQLPAHRWITGVLLAALTIPVTVYYANEARHQIGPAARNPNLITHAEDAALTYLAHLPGEGSVLAGFPLGDKVPGETGRRTFVGDLRWTENYARDERISWNLLHGWLGPPAARSFVRATGASFILADCTSKTNLAAVLGPLVSSEWRFGCVTLYRLELAG